MTAVDEHPLDRMSVLGLILPALPGLLLRLGGTFIRFKRRAKLAGRTFEHELRIQGLDSTIAGRLTDAYLENSSIRHYIYWWR